ncbi:hypothetical protein [uncultured Methanobrevibacter sp.]|uniref:hypothetical protein n=1 Tax=uncultured Methanobrevibacter sp. TaxID=253161 RepID=UPI0026093A38|nr:hypothetical protein [uncultured Methanobrevibacter sp.]
MDKHIQNLMEEHLNFTVKNKYLFHELCGLTFVFRREILCLNDQASSSELRPVGIIYEENNEYYYAPLHEGDEIDEIVKAFVEKI